MARLKVAAIVCAVSAAGLVLCLGALPLCAETFGVESSLVWRSDGTGDFLLPEILPGAAYTSDPAIETRGVITSLVVTWKAEGPLRLEVSADSGLHYTQAVCGLPLTRGFVPGTSLKWRVSLGPGASLQEVKIDTRDSSGVVRGFGAPELSGFPFRKSVFVSGSRTGHLFGYQVKIVVGESEGSAGCHIHASGRARPDFGDIRFTLPDGETLLPYHLEKVTGEAPARAAEFFVKIPQVPPEGLGLYVYYGNRQAATHSDAEATFDFYDDFKAPAPDDTKWTVRRDPGANVQAAADGLLLDAAGITSKVFQFAGGIIEYSATAETGYETRLVIRDPDPDSESDLSQVAYASGFPGAEHCIAVGNIVKANLPRRIAAVTRYDYRVTVEGADITFERYDPGFLQKQASVTDRDTQGPRIGYIGLKAAGAGRGRSLTKFHWIRVRKYSFHPPQAVPDMKAPQEAVTAPVFRNIVLAANGDLVLAPGRKDGSYTTREVFSPYGVRILVPGWKGAGVSVDVSADGGRNYKKDCAQDIFLYASRGDFIRGGCLKGRVVFKRASPFSGARLESFALVFALGNIVVLAPNGGEQWRLKTEQGIGWTAWDYERSYPMKIEYSLDAGKAFVTLVPAAENSGKYRWRLPDDPAFVTDAALIRVSDGLDPSFADTSDNSFSITR